MAEELERAERFRLRAEEVRAIAQNAHDKSVRASLLKIADDYERMAASLDAVHKTVAVLRSDLGPDKG